MRLESTLKKIGTAMLLLSMLLGWHTKASADEPFIGEMRWFAGNFAPRGWALCDGQILPIAQNTALFSLLGTTYGGDGRSTFGLPDMRGRFPLHQGSGPGLSNRRLGQRGGTETETLTTQQLPGHTHQANGTMSRGNQGTPANNHLARQRRDRLYDSVSGSNPADVTLSSEAVGTTGGSAAHDNIHPYLGINCIIALQGIYPSRN